MIRWRRARPRHPGHCRSCCKERPATRRWAGSGTMGPMARGPRLALTGLAVLVTSALALAGCGGSSRSPRSSQPAPPSTTSSSSGPPSSGPSSTGPPSTGPRSTGPSSTGPSSTGPPSTSAPPTTPPGPGVSLSEPDNGRTVTVARGEPITVVLHSTYWTFNPPSNAAVVQPAGSPTVAPKLQGCVPGGGCGTVTARYTPVAAGRSQLSAHRDSCGEARQCGPGEGDWKVNVVVTA